MDNKTKSLHRLKLTYDWFVKQAGEEQQGGERGERRKKKTDGEKGEGKVGGEEGELKKRKEGKLRDENKGQQD